MGSTSCFNLLSIISLVLLLSCFLTCCHENYHLPFLSTLKGAKKGDRAKGVEALRKYLARIGYTGDDGGHMMSPHVNDGNNDPSYFDEKLESAIKTYQQVYNLKPTGIVDAPTIDQLNRRRCGVKDTPSQMLNSKKGTSIKPQFTISNYTWPPGKRKLTYSYPKNMDELARPAIAMATGIWTDNTPFDINFEDTFELADIRMSFKWRDQGPLDPFDGPGGALAMAAYPTDGTMVFNAEDDWVPIADKGFDLASVTLHELGHSLGLMHSTDETAVMYAYMAENQSKWVLTKDDLDGFKALYPNN